MQRATRFNRPTLRGSSVAALLFDKQDSFVLKAAPDTTTSTSLAWSEPSQKPDNYRVERSTDGTTFSTVTTLANTDFSYNDTGLTESTKYWYRIVPILGGADQPASNIADTWTVPSTPTGLTATTISSTQIDLAWSDVSTGNTAQSIQRRSPAGSGSYSFIASVGATANSYSDTGLTAATQYEYQVAATNPATQSAWSTAANATTTGGGPTAAWTLDFSSGTPSGYTLTRASTGTYVDSSGYIASASTDIARLTHDSSGSRLGLLVEEAATNVAQYSEDFANAYWTKTNTTIDDNGGSFWTSPANASDAVLLEQTTASGSHRLERAVSGTDRNWAIFVKKQNLTTGSGRAGRYVTLLLRGVSTEYVHATFDLDTGTKTAGATVVGTVFSGADAGIEAYANDWYRVWITATRASGTATCIVSLATTGTPTMTSQGESYTGANATDGIYVWGAQSEARNAPPTSYIKTPSNASVTRSADLVHVLDSTITGWQDPGALVVHFYPPPQTGTLLSTDDASAEQLGIEASSTTAVRAFWSNGQTATGTMTTGVQKAVHYWNGTASSFCLNGGTVQTGTNNVTTFGNIDFVTFGAEATDSSGTPGTFSQHSNLIIRKVEFYSGTLTSGDLQTITT